MVVNYKCENCGSELTFDADSKTLLCHSCETSTPIGENNSIEHVNNDFFSCPQCSEQMEYDETSLHLVCSTCGHSYHSDECQNITHIAEFKNTTPQISTGQYDSEIAQEYHCVNCNAVLVTDKHTAVTTCSFCYASMILSDQLSGEYAPLKILPFKISMETTHQLFKEWRKKIFLAPSIFHSLKRVKDIKGIYVPFWLFDLEGHGEIYADCTKKSISENSDTITTYTRHYKVYRRGKSGYLKLPADASEKLDDNVMDRLEPFHYEELENFDMAYLTGFGAEKYNYTDQELLPRIHDRVSEYLYNYLYKNIGYYSTINTNGFNVEVIQKNATYVLLPVYFLNYSFKDQLYTFAVNGQTGKIIGNPPIDKVKVTFLFIGLTMVFYYVISLILPSIIEAWN